MMTREEAIRILERKTTIPEDGVAWEQINQAIEMAVAALRAHEDTGLDPKRVVELVQAEKEGRLVVLPCGDGVELIKNGLTFKADHWNVSLTAFADDASTPSGKRVKLFSPEEAEAAMKKRNEEPR